MDTNLFDHKLVAESVVECEESEVQIKYAELAEKDPPKDEAEAMNLLLQARKLTCTKEVHLGSIKELIGVRDPYPDGEDGIPIAPHIAGLVWILLCTGVWTFLANFKWIPMNFWSHLFMLSFVSITAHWVFIRVQKNCE